jgi:FkbH-like protein
VAIVIDPGPLIMELGSARWFAARYWYHAKLPCHPNAMIALGRHLATTIARCIVRPVKVIACDLDDTLWGGTVGEDGWRGLRLDPHGTGAPYIRLQAFLKDLAERGVLLVALSKNNEADVREVFQKRTEMLLRWEDFAASRVNWRTKSENLRDLSETLRLDLGSFCLLDDSPFERAEVRHALPTLIVPELPTAPEDFVSFLARCGLFQIPIVTAEDRDRGRHYRDETARETSLKASASYEDFLRTLDLRAVAEPIDSANIERVVQLVGKTNQFNLTTRRHDLGMIRRLIEDRGAFAYCYRVLDRFGDAGVTGVLIATCDMGSCRIDTWLLSCRVMGRTVERAMFAHLLEWLRARDIRRLVADYVPTKKNEPVTMLLPELGFVEIARGADGVVTYQRSADASYGGNRFVRLILDESADSSSSRAPIEFAS